MPSVDGRSGSHFFAKYRIKGETTWLSTDNILEDDYVLIRGLQPDETYEFIVASVDGEYLAESHVQDVPTIGIGEYECTGFQEKRCNWSICEVFLLVQ